MASYQEATARLKKKVKSAMTYPMIVCFIAMGIALFLIVKVIPIFADIYKDFGGATAAADADFDPDQRHHCARIS